MTMSELERKLNELRAYVSDIGFKLATTKEEKLAAIFIHPLLDDHDTGENATHS